MNFIDIGRSLENLQEVYSSIKGNPNFQDILN